MAMPMEYEMLQVVSRCGRAARMTVPPLVFAGLAVATLAAGNIGTAGAADLGAPRRPVYQPTAPLDLGRPERVPDRWSGFYLGGTLGYGFGDTRTDGTIGSGSFSTEGLLGTIHAGYNWQLGNAVLGVEADIGFGGLGGAGATPFGNLTGDLNVMSSLRGRAGFLAGPALLIYGTAGLAIADVEFNLAGAQARSETFFGYQAGLGAELAVSSHVSLRLEYLYTDLERERVIHAGQLNTYDPDFHTLRAGFSFRF